jgi:sugar phosphate isomerase/epimerase
MGQVKLGVSLYCFSREYISGEYSLEDCIRRCAELGVDGYEIVGAQMVPSYPYVSDDFLGMINSCAAEYGVRPVSYGANTDRGMRHDRDLNEKELLHTTIRDIRTASKLGCKVMRAQYLLSPKVMGMIAPYAENYGVKVGIEIHNPETPSTPIMQEYLEVYEKTGSKYIGFVPDFGAFADKPNIDSYQGALERGAHKELLDMAVKFRYDNIPMNDAMKQLQDMGADGEVMGAFFAMYGFLAFSKEPDLEGLKNIMPYCFHFHGKFHHMNDDGTEMSIPYEKILPVIKSSDFNGYIVSEYERHNTGQALEMTKKHIAMERRILGI